MRELRACLKSLLLWKEEYPEATSDVAKGGGGYYQPPRPPNRRTPLLEKEGNSILSKQALKRLRFYIVFQVFC